ncbi:MAG: TonB-dependent receptor [Methylobacter sp.]|nr:MAG: TonB-dependent receptor [Methylobacter sp.]
MNSLRLSSERFLLFVSKQAKQSKWHLLATGVLVTVSPLSVAKEATAITLSPMTIVSVPQQLDEISEAYSSQNSQLYNETKLGLAHEQTIDEVLTGERGIAITKPGTQGTGRIYLRGVGGRGLMMLDGIPLLDSVPNAMNLNAVIPDGLSEMEVTRGFAPVSRPFAALGGAIRMTSRNATDNSADLRVEGGTYGFLKETLRNNFASEHARLAITTNRSEAFDGAYQAQQDNGNSERDPFHSTQVMMKAGVDISKDIIWEASMLYRHSHNNTDIPVVRGGIIQQADDNNAFLNDEGWLAQNTLKAKISENWITRLQLGYSKNALIVSQPLVSPSLKTDFYLARWENDQRLWQDNDDTFHIVWGAEERYESGSAPIVDRGPPPKATGVTVSTQRHQQAGFLDNRFAYGIFSGDVGVRYEGYERYNNQVLLHLGTAWQLLPRLKLTSNAGNGFRIPSYSELLFPMTGDLNLKPERNIGGDLGIEWQALSAVKLNATGFYTRYTDLIALSYNVKPPCGSVCLSNIANAVIAGMETGSDITINKQWRGGVAYTYTDTQNLLNNRDIPFRPRHISRVWGEWRSADLPLTLWTEGVYQSQSKNDMANTSNINDSFRINIHANYQMTPKLDLYVRGENLTNNTTPAMFSFNQAGATVYGGMLLKLW